MTSCVLIFHTIFTQYVYNVVKCEKKTSGFKLLNCMTILHSRMYELPDPFIMCKSFTTDDYYTCHRFAGEIILSFHSAESYVENVRFSDSCYQPNRPRITDALKQQSERKGRVRQPPGAISAFTAHKDTSNKLLLVIAKVAVSQRKQVWAFQWEIYVCLVCALPSG